MKVSFECTAGGILYHKDVEMDNLPSIGDIMKFPIGDKGEDVPLAVTAVSDEKVSLEAKSLLGFQQMSHDGWSIVSGVSFQYCYENFSDGQDE